MSKNNFMCTLLVGAASAATALLLAPKSGRELREDLKDEALSLKKQAMDKVSNYMDEIKETYREVEEEVNYTNPDLAETIDNIESDLNTKQATPENNDVILHSSQVQTSMPSETSGEYPPLEDLESPVDLKIQDKRGQL
ncbi:YtxH domain-containing protein [Carnobacterium mobile]|uniref:YtxH domain-containing protein n=1 Tax=Carnobacterium mobile TaxID=2750 RepID=UPI00054D34A2|nr:YtxH domain-containing protein [Carnobacterium mobile]